VIVGAIGHSQGIDGLTSPEKTRKALPLAHTPEFGSFASDCNPDAIVIGHVTLGQVFAS